jgi:5-methylcytosine-specific restriction endonuclease McrA
MAIEDIPPIVTYSQAKAHGLKRYFTGKPCRYGHVAERCAANGQCFECASIKHRRWRSKNLEFARERYRKWKSANPEVAKAAAKAWREKNPEKPREYARRAYRKHIKKRKEWQKSYSAANRERILGRVRKWAADNPERRKEIVRKWNRDHPEYVRAANSLQAARRRNADGRFDVDDVARLFEVQKGKCAYCRRSLKNGFHIDHIVPLANGGTNWPDNLQLCCERCNCRKGAKDAISFAQSLGRLL